MKSDTRKAFLDCVFKIASREELCEKQRQKLCNEPLFNPYHVFMRLSYQKNIITVKSLLQFTKEKSLSCCLKDAHKIVQYFGDGEKIEYSDFLQMILPTCNSSLRSFAAQKDIKGVMKLDASLEYSVQQLISRELDFHKTLEHQINLLTLRTSFSVGKIFNEMHKKTNELIEIEDIAEFIKKQKIIPNYVEIIAFVRRVDQNADGKLSYNELCDIFLPKNMKGMLSTSIGYNPIKSPPIKQKEQSHQKPHSVSMLGTSKPSYYKSPMKVNSDSDLSFFSGILKEQVMLEKELEVSKETLALKSDFNLFGGFKMFDKDMKGYATSLEIKQALSELAIDTVSTDVDLIMRRYSKSNDGKLRYSEFCAAFTPKQKEYAMLLSGRTPISQDFCLQTRVAFKSFLKTIIKVENLHENFRMKIANSNCRIDELFRLIAKQNDYITKDCFEVFLEENGYLALERDLRILMDMYDQNENGKITLADFASVLQYTM